MCLGIPGQVIELMNTETFLSEAIVDFGGIKKKINVSCLADLIVGDYVVVHAGVAIQKINEIEATKLISLLNNMIQEKL